jgi:hypothetical protein
VSNDTGITKLQKMNDVMAWFERMSQDLTRVTEKNSQENMQ